MTAREGAPPLMLRLEAALAAARAAGAAEAEASWEGSRQGVLRFAASRPTQAMVVHEGKLRLRVALAGGRTGSAIVGTLDADALAGAARAAHALATVAPPDASFAGFAPPDAALPLEGPAADAGCEATRAAGPGERAAVLAAMAACATPAGLELAGRVATEEHELAVATTAGARALHRSTEASLTVIAHDADASGYAAAVHADLAALDPRALATRAVEGACRARGATTLAPGPHDVLLSPWAVSELLEWIALGSFGAGTVLDGTSLLAGRRGEPVTGPAITLVDDPDHPHPAALRRPFDAEGTPRTRVVLIDHGKAGDPVTDRSTAARLGRPPTGHAPPLGEDLWGGPFPPGLALVPGTDTEEQLLARLGRGLLVTRLHYVNGLDEPRRAVLTGMTRDGLHRVESGRLAGSVHNLRFADAFVDAFARVDGVGADLIAVATHWTRGGRFLCPWLLVRALGFTGSTR